MSSLCSSLGSSSYLYAIFTQGVCAPAVVCTICPLAGPPARPPPIRPSPSATSHLSHFFGQDRLCAGCASCHLPSDVVPDMNTAFRWQDSVLQSHELRTMAPSPRQTFDDRLSAAALGSGSSSAGAQAALPVAPQKGAKSLRDEPRAAIPANKRTANSVTEITLLGVMNK